MNSPIGIGIPKFGNNERNNLKHYTFNLMHIKNCFKTTKPFNHTIIKM